MTDNQELKTCTVLNNICFYDKNGEIKNEFTFSIRKILLETVNIEDFEDWEIDRAIFDIDNQGREYSPVSISAGGVKFDSRIKFLGNPIVPDLGNGEFRGETTYLDVQCHSNIWFPWLWTDKNELFDNRELAYCHTPRLNNFTSEIDALIVDFGGRYGGKEVCSDFYDRQVNGYQILLDVDPSYLD